MAIELPIDPKLLERAFALSGEKTRQAVVVKALEEFIARHEQRKILDLIGTLEWDEGYDHKKGRSERERKLGLGG